MLRKNLLAVILLLVCFSSYAQVSETFRVNGDPDKFYPVTFFDGAWEHNVATVLQIGVSDVHENGSWSGSVISDIRFHTMSYGNGSNFINADIRQTNLMIAGWEDVSTNNSIRRIVIWIRGNRKYYYTSNYQVYPQVYDDVQNPLPFQAPFGATDVLSRSFKTQLDEYVSISGSTFSNNAEWSGTVKADALQIKNFKITSIKGNYGDIANNLFFQNNWKHITTGPSNLLRMGEPENKRSDFIFYVAPSNTAPGADANFMEVMRVCENGSVGIGTGSPGNYKLAVEGLLGARKIKVQQGSWADYVFHPEYKLASLDSVEHFIKMNRHLPDIPAEKEVLAEGIDVGEMNKKLLQKIEELTLYLIESRKEYRTAIEELKKENEQLKNKLNSDK